MLQMHRKASIKKFLANPACVKKIILDTHAPIANQTYALNVPKFMDS